MKQPKRFVSLFAFLLLGIFACKTGEKINKNAPESKFLGTWQAKNIEKNGRIIDINALAGEVLMEFRQSSKKQADGKMKIVYKARIEMGGSDRIFDYVVANDSVKYQGVEGWNDMKIISQTAEELKFDQIVDDDLLRWNMFPRPDLDKKRKEEEAAKKAELKKMPKKSK
jgi:hypothetical protein